MRVVATLAVLVLSACKANPTASTLEEAVRAACWSGVKVLASDDDFVVAMTKNLLLQLERSKDGEWVLRTCVPLPEDWISESSRGFSTYADENVARAAYSSYLKALSGPGALDATLSNRSMLARTTVRRFYGTLRDHIDGDPTESFASECFGSEGRYAFFVASGIYWGTCNDLYYKIEGIPRLIVLRADDGRVWKMYDEGVMTSGELEGVF